MSRQPERPTGDWMWPERPGLPILDERLDDLSKLVLAATDAAYVDTFGQFHQFSHDEGWYVSSAGNVVHETVRAVQNGLPELSIGVIIDQKPGKDIVMRDHEVLTLGEGRPPRLELVREFRRYKNPLFTTVSEGCIFEKTIEAVTEPVLHRFLDYNLPSPNILASWKRPMIKHGSVSDLMEINGRAAAPLWWERDPTPPIMHVTALPGSPAVDALALVEAFYTQVEGLMPEDIIDI